MELSSREKRLLACVQHHAQGALKEYAAALGCQEHTIRYLLSGLKERNVIVGSVPFVNLYPAGYTSYTLFFSLVGADPAVHDKILRGLVRSPRIWWAARLGGQYELAVAILARRIEEVADFFDQVSRKYGDVFQDKSLAITRTLTAYSRKYLAPDIGRRSPAVYFGGSDAQLALDQLDHEILATMSRGWCPSNRELARQLQISHTALARRRAALEEHKVITGYIYRIDLRALGMQTYRLLLSAHGMSHELSRNLRRFAETHPNVLRFMETMGAWDYEMEVEVPQAEQVTDVVRALRQQFGKSLATIRQLQIFQHLKLAIYPQNQPAKDAGKPEKGLPAVESS